MVKAKEAIADSFTANPGASQGFRSSSLERAQSKNQT
jgi:hypothetical protein